LKATLLVLPRVESDLEHVRSRDFSRIIETMEFLCEFPFAAQTAGFSEAPAVRRAVSGQYLIYYRYRQERNAVLIYTVRHSRQKPAKFQDVVPG